MTCDACGKLVEIGEWPYCPHGVPGGMLGEYKAHWEDNLGPNPVWVTSLAQKQALLRGDGTRPRLVEMDHKLTPSQAMERMHARREKAQRQARERAS